MKRWKLIVPAVAISVLIAMLVLIPKIDESSSDEKLRAYLSSSEFDLTYFEELTGKKLIPSDGYSISTYYEVLQTHTRVERLENFLKLHEERGIPRVTLYFKEKPVGNDYLKVEFPGCLPQKCEDVAQSVSFIASSEDEWNEYDFPSRDGRETLFLPAITIDEIDYSIDATLFFDQRGRVTEVFLNASRDAVSDWELFKVRVSSGGATQVPVYWGYKIFSQQMD